MALAHCIPGKFLEVVCHCFPPPLDVPTFAATCLYVRNNTRDPSREKWNCRREIYPVILPKFRLPLNLGIFYMQQIYDMGPTALLPLRRKACWGFFALKIRRLRPGLNPRIWVCVYIYIYIRTLMSRTVQVAVYKTADEPIQQNTAVHNNSCYDELRWNSLSSNLLPISILQISTVL